MNTETKKIATTKEIVIELIKKNPEYKDNDERLVANFWFRQLRAKGINPETITGFELLKIYSENKILTSADCIVRARAKLQQDCPEYRGNNWRERHQDGVEVSMEIHEI